MLRRNQLLLLSCLAVAVTATPVFNLAPGPAVRARVQTSTSVSATSISVVLDGASTTTFTSTSTSTQYGPTPTCTQTIKPDKNGYVPPNTCGSLYDYYPSFAAAIIFSVLFGGPMVAHIAQAAIHKKKFCWVIIMGTIWEFGSYVSRAVGTRNQQSSGIALVSQLLVLLAPLWVNAFDYMVLGRMIQFFVPAKKLWFIKPSILAFSFVCLDIASFFIQLIGGASAGPGASPKAQLKGIHIYMGGIGLQEFFIVIFFGLSIKFHIEMLKAERAGLLAGDKAKWRQLLFTLYGSLIAITIRIIYRLAEFSKGNGSSNPLPYHEAYFYVFDGIPMFIAILLWNIRHPGVILQGPDAEIPQGWLGRKMAGCCGCCSCCGSRKSRGTHQRLADNDDEELKALRSRDPSPYRPEGRGKSGNRYDTSSLPPSRDPSPYRPLAEPGQSAVRYDNSYNSQNRQLSYTGNNLAAPNSYGNGA